MADSPDPRHPVAHLHTGRSNDKGFLGGWLSRLAGSQSSCARGGRSEEGRREGRALRFGVVTGFPTEDPASRSLLTACSTLGETWPLSPASLAVEVGGGSVEIRFGGHSASMFDVLLLVRGIGPSGNEEAQLGAYRLLEEEGHLLMNSCDALLSAQDKMRTSVLLSRAGVPTPGAWVVQDPLVLPGVLDHLGAAVAKPQWGSLGEGVELLDTGEAGVRRARRLLDERGSLHLQAFVDHGGWDIRAFVVGGSVCAAIERRAPPGEIRTNVEVGGSVRALPLSSDLEGIAIRATEALGLEWAGVDLAIGSGGPSVIEVNGSPGWSGIQEATGQDMGEAIALHAARRALDSIEHRARRERG